MNAGNILIEYHPHSGKITRILSPEEFKESLGDYLEPMDQPDDEPWRPFRSREDFEFADLVHDAALNQTQIEWLMKFVQHCQDMPVKHCYRVGSQKYWKSIARARVTSTDQLVFQVLRRPKIRWHDRWDERNGDES